MTVIYHARKISYISQLGNITLTEGYIYRSWQNGHNTETIDKYKTWSFHLEETSSEILQLVQDIRDGVTLGVSDGSYMSAH